MKKWIKATIIAAVVLVLIGGIMTIICLTLGARWDDASVRIRIPGTGHYQHESADLPDRDTELSDGDGKVWTPDSGKIRSLELSVDMGEMYVQEGDEYRVEVQNPRDTMRCEVRNGVLIVDEEEGFHFFSLGSLELGVNGIRAELPIITVTVPEGTVFERLEVSVGAGIIEAESLEAESAQIDVDAGSFVCGDLRVNGKCQFDVDAGSAEVDGGCCGKNLDLDVDAGGLTLLNFDSAAVTMDVDAGSIEYSGTIRGSWTADCDVGSITMELDAAEKDYNYAVDSDMGSVQIGSREFSGMSASQDIRNGAEYTAKIDCDMGSVEVIFTR